MLILNAGNTSFISKLLHWLNGQDQVFFLYINRYFKSSVTDSIFPIWRDAQTWYPFYLFILVFILVNFGKKGLFWILFFVLTVAVSDQISSAFIKDFFARPRPCGDPQFSQFVRLLLNRCPSSGSFTSSHASNHFAMACFIVYTLKEHIGKYKYLVYVWAASICYAQVYVGVHYPLDVIGGALIGCIIAYASSSFFNRRIGPLTLVQKNNLAA
jgi:membrane-associated phospholipid phosphatase